MDPEKGLYLPSYYRVTAAEGYLTFPLLSGAPGPSFTWSWTAGVKACCFLLSSGINFASCLLREANISYIHSVPCVFYLFFEAGSLYIGPAFLELTM